MDEPLGALDKKLREQMQYEIKHIHEKIGITVVYVTHDQAEALTMSNRIAVFNDGKIQQISSPDILYEKPDNAFVANFIGENNQLKGKVKWVHGENCIITTESGDDIEALKINVNNSGDSSLVFDPSVVLMDEPLGALDKNLRESMQYEIKHIHESIGVTVVYVTHDQGEALTMSNRIAVFNDGKVQQLSSPDKLYEEPVNSFVAEFIGENNTFSGQVTDIYGSKCKVKLDSGSEIMSNPIRVNSKGEKTIVSLRPERAIINPENNMENKHKGKIEEVIYHGDHTRVRLNLLGNKEFILKVPNSSARMDIKVGNEIAVGWDSQDARALDPK